jgi:hypothetical protein
MMHKYDRAYYEYINRGSIRSAEALLPIVARHFSIRSVADFGAGQGAWLSVWRRLGISDISALDGAYVDQSSLLVPKDSFVAVDVSQHIRLGRVFDLVQSLEVAEHLPASAAERFVDNLVAHGSVVLFSAAAPGQGGEHHVNEQPYSYWHRLFGARGYVMLDAIRPFVATNTDVEPWYRYNTFLYVEKSCLPSLPAALRHLRIADFDEVRDVSPLCYRLRKAIIRAFPVWAVTRGAVFNKHWHLRLREESPA